MTMRKILISVDGSEHSDQAARFAADFAKEHGPVEIHLVNVEPKPIPWQTRGMEPEAIHAHLKSLCHQTMTSAHDILKAAGVPCHTHAKIGDVAEEVVALADKLGCDSIVIGTRGLGAVSGLALGSITRKVLHLSQVPVICVK
ncbi:universal stress protein [Propionivibrio limicola]|uniref:universal stress protein n=1 Tax=Propionivibrio limicola TaxID=167645 RepID=UPI001290D355|nr:universal stress protein [Propionivibrio limicola]